MKCKTCTSLFIEALYDELAAPQKMAFQQHISACEGCAKSYQAMQSTLQVMHAREKPNVNAEFMDSLWANVRPALEPGTARPHEKRRANWLQLIAPRWAMGLAAAAALFVLGIIVGHSLLAPPRYSKNEIMPSVQVDRAAVQEVEQRSARYLDRSKVLLLGLINYETAEGDSAILNLDVKKRISQQLVQEAGVLKDDLSKVQHLRMQKLVADIEMILLQIANLEEAHDLPSIEIIRSSVDRKGIMLKINLEQMKSQEHKPVISTENENKSTI